MILFLDFDGVLHPEYQGTTVLEEVAFCHLPRFEAVMRDYPHVDIVISSTWRETLPLDRMTVRFAPDIRERIVGMTPIDGREGFVPNRREGEVLRWLEENGRSAEEWLVLDDRIWQFPRHRDRVVACVNYKGFDEAVAATLRTRLGLTRTDGHADTGQTATFPRAAPGDNDGR